MISDNTVSGKVVSTQVVSTQVVSTQVVSNHVTSYCGIQWCGIQQIIVKTSKPRQLTSLHSLNDQKAITLCFMLHIFGILCSQIKVFTSCSDVKPAISALQRIPIQTDSNSLNMPHSMQLRLHVRVKKI